MNIDYEDVHRFKRLNLPDLLRNYGHVLKQKGPNSYFTHCPFHDDKEPSLSVSQKNDVWLWHCFGCRKGGTVIDFVMKKENLSLQETYSKLKGNLPGASIREARPLNSMELLKHVADFYHKTFLSDKRGHDYLKSRSIHSPEIYTSFKIGFANGALKKTLSLTSALCEDLKQVGILNAEANEFFYNAVVIPLLDEDGNVVSFYGRNIERKSHLYLRGPHRGLVNRQGASNTEKIILTESILDALSLYELGERQVIPCYGTGGFTPDHEELLKTKRIKDVEIAFDSDEAGEKGAEALADRLLRMNIKTSRVKLPRGMKDLNDFLTAGKTKADFLSLTRERSETPLDLYTAVKENAALSLKIKDRDYRVRVQDEAFQTRLKVNVRLVTPNLNHIDIIDLYSERQRKLYARRVFQKIAVSDSEIERDLYRMIDEIEKDFTLVEDDKKTSREMSEPEKVQALLALKNPHLMSEIVSDLEKMGCVGEDASKLLGYIVTVSRKLEWPLSMIIVSQSGAGKSNLADTLEGVIPEEECVHLSRITPQALYYMERTELKRKVLIIEEKEGSESADYSIRVLQSKKVLRLALPVKDPKSGNSRTKVIEVEGPVVIIETTTKSELNPENTSRCFIVYLDESEEQTKRIHAYQRFQKTLEGAHAKKDAEALTRKHQNMQRLLKPLLIHIPYVNHIHFPTKWMRTRRDLMKFLNLIEAVTFLHQHQREIKKTADGIECIEATLEDYKVAYEISKDVFGDSLSELMKPEKDFLEKIKSMLEEKGMTRFTRREVREHTNLPDHSVRKSLRILEELEYLLIAQGQNGLRYEYELNSATTLTREIILGLTTPDDLEKALREPCRKVNPIKLNGISAPCELLEKT